MGRFLVLSAARAGGWASGGTGLALLIGMASLACGSPDDSQTLMTSDSSPASATVVQLLQEARTTAAADGDLEQLAKKVAELDSADQRRFAAGLEAEPAPALLQLRASLLYRLGDEQGGDQAVAELVIRGIDPLGLFYGWMHSGEPKLATRRFVGISRALLQRYPDSSAEALRFTDSFLCEESFGGPLESCTRELIEQRLEQLDATL